MPNLIDKKNNLDVNPEIDINPFKIDKENLLAYNYNIKNVFYLNKAKQRHSLIFTYSNSEVKNNFSFGSTKNSINFKRINIIHKIGDIIFVKKIKNIWVLKQYPKVNGGIVALDPFSGDVLALVGGFNFKNSCIAKAANGKGEYKERGNKKILPIKYTPDFIGSNFIIECKGRANESFPLRWKLFKKHLVDNKSYPRIYKPQNQKECDETVRLILSFQK